MHYSIVNFELRTDGPLGRRLQVPDGYVPLFDLRKATIQGQTAPGWCFASSVAAPGSEAIDLGSGSLATVAATSKLRSAWKDATGYKPSGTTLQEIFLDFLENGSDPFGETAAKPLTADGRSLKLWLPGHGLVSSAAFDPTKHLKSAQVYQEAYREMASRSEDLSLKYLDWLGDKFGIDKPQDFFIPNDMPKVSPRKHETWIAESFNTADSNTLGPDLTWTEYLQNWEIVSNKAALTGLGGYGRARAGTDLSGTDHYAEAEGVMLGGTNHQAGTAVRYSSAADTCYVADAIRLGTDNLYLLKFVAGAQTVLGVAPAFTYSAGAKVKCKISGSTLSSHYNGTQIESITDTALTTGTRCGIHGYSGGTAITVDNFVAGDNLVSLVVPAATGTGTVVAPTVTLGGVTLVVPDASATGSVVEPTVIGGAVVLTVPEATATGTVVAPTVIPGAVSVVVPAATATATIVAPSLIAGAITVSVTGVALGTGSVVAPTLIPGAVSVTVPIISRSAIARNVDIRVFSAGAGGYIPSGVAAPESRRIGPRASSEDYRSGASTSEDRRSGPSRSSS